MTLVAAFVRLRERNRFRRDILSLDPGGTSSGLSIATTACAASDSCAPAGSGVGQVWVRGRGCMFK